jgi:hypothetical protein
MKGITPTFDAAWMAFILQASAPSFALLLAVLAVKFS